MTKYSLNERFFDEIDSEEVAFFTGLLLADGHISESEGGSVSIELQDRDVDVLEKLKGALNYTGPVLRRQRKSDGRFYVKLCVNNGSLVRALRVHGVVPRKTFIASAPKIRLDLQRHFWRGMVDGDDSLFMSRIRGNQSVWCLKLAGTNGVCESFGKFLADNGMAHNRKGSCQLDGAKRREKS